MEEVKVFKAVDGELFENREECIRYDNAITIMQLVSLESKNYDFINMVQPIKSEKPIRLTVGVVLNERVEHSNIEIAVNNLITQVFGANILQSAGNEIYKITMCEDRKKILNMDLLLSVNKETDVENRKFAARHKIAYMAYYHMERIENLKRDMVKDILTDIVG